MSKLSQTNSPFGHDRPPIGSNMKLSGLLKIYYFTFKTFQEAQNLTAYLCQLLPKFESKNIEVGLNEIFFNAIEHGNLGIGTEEKNKIKANNLWQQEIERRFNMPGNSQKKVSVKLMLSPTDITLTVKDEGQGFDWLHSKLFQTSFEHSGRGLLMAFKLCFDKLEFSNKGNEITSIIYLAGSEFRPSSNFYR